MSVQNAADHSQVKAAAKEERFMERQKRDDLRHLISTEPGRRFAYQILEYCGVFRTSFSTSALIYFNEGKRDVGLWLMARITELDEAKLLDIMREGRGKGEVPQEEGEPHDDNRSES